MTNTNHCVLCFLALAVAVTLGLNEANSTEEPSSRIVRSPQGSMTGAVLGANILFIGQAARSGHSVLESKLSAAKAMVEAGSDIVAAKFQAAGDMAGVALNGGKTIAGTTLGSISETADSLVVALGYPSEVSRRRRNSERGWKQQGDEDDDRIGRGYDDRDDEFEGKETDDDGFYKSGKRDEKYDEDKSKQDEKENDETKESKKDKSKKKGDRKKRDAAKEDLGARRKRSLTPDKGRNGKDSSQTARLMGSPCIGCMAETMSRTVALKGGAVGGAVGMIGGKRRASGVGGGSAGVGIGAGVVGVISGGSGGKAGAGHGLVGGSGGKAGAGHGLIGGSGGKAGAGVFKGAIGGAIGGKVAVVGRRKREARRFGGGRSRFSPSRGGAAKKGQSDTSGGSESSGGSSTKTRRKRAVIDHVLQHLRRDKRQDTPPATGHGGKSHCFSFHSLEESEEEKKFWEDFHNMMNEHDNDWKFDFETEMCGAGGGSTGAVSTNAVEGTREATTPLPPTIEA